MEKLLKSQNTVTAKGLESIKKIVGVLIGSFIFAFAINGVYVPFGFLSTGFNGVSLMLNYLFGWSIPILSFALNIIFVFAGLKLINRSFAFMSVIGITFVSIFLQVTSGIKLSIDDPLLAAVFGGLLLGVGVGIALKSGGALGGMNILGKIVNQYFSISIGQFDMAFNSVLFAISCLVFDINIVLYTIMTRFVATKVIDAIVMGFDKKKTLLIVSEKYQIIAEQLMVNPKRGVTLIASHGAFTGKEKSMIYCVVNLTQLSKAKEIIKRIDSKAFITVLDATEVNGNGF